MSAARGGPERTANGFRDGAIEASAGFSHERGSGVRVTAGAVTVWVQATLAGRRVWVEVSEGAPGDPGYQHHAFEFGGKEPRP